MITDAADQDQPIEVSVRELRENLADVLNGVSARGRTVYVTSRGRRVAAVVPLVVADREPAD